MDSYHNNRELLQQILKKYVNGTATEAEIKFLDQYDEYIDRNTHAFADLPEEEQVEIAFKLRHRLDREMKSKPAKRISWTAYAAAVALFLVIGLGLYYYLQRPSSAPTELLSQYGGDVLPGSNKATITLSDGSRYELNGDKAGITVGADGIAYTDGGLIAATDQVVTAVIAVPRGGIYHVTLQDGTKVSLNSGSTLHYPVHFNGTERKVVLEGEGYFEVARNAQQPFIVQTGVQKLKVLGTHFNIQAYPGEKISSTLLEGSVELTAGNGSTRLKPGYQAILNDNNYSVREVSVDDYTAWTRNLFTFNMAPLSEVFKQLERWYDVDIEYPATIGNERHFMEIPKESKLSEVLTSLSAFIKIKFSIEGRRVIVRQ